MASLDEDGYVLLFDNETYLHYPRVMQAFSLAFACTSVVLGFFACFVFFVSPYWKE